MIKKNIKTRVCADGSELTINVFCFKGTKKMVPSVYIQSGIHGSEVQGYLVCLLLIDHFIKYPPLGNVTIVPIANPYGINCKMGEYTLGRFDSVTGDNWNRNYMDLSFLIDDFLLELSNHSFSELIPLFKEKMRKEIKKKSAEKHNSYATKLALEIQQLAISADIILDLHCDTYSLPHIYCSNYLLNSVSYLGIPYIIETPYKFAGALEEAIFYPWKKLVDFYNMQNNEQYTPIIEAFTIELGNQEKIDKYLAEKQLNNILNYLKYKGTISALDKVYDNQITVCKLEDFQTIYTSTGGLVLEYAALGQPLTKQDTLAHIRMSKTLKNIEFSKNFIQDGTLLVKNSYENAIPLTYSASPIVHEGMALMKIMTNYEVREKASKNNFVA